MKLLCGDIADSVDEHEDHWARRGTCCSGFPDNDGRRSGYLPDDTEPLDHMAHTTVYSILDTLVAFHRR